MSQADDTALSANSAHRLAPITYAFTPDQTGVSRIEGITNQILVVVQLALASESETFASHQRYLINDLVTACRLAKPKGTQECCAMVGQKGHKSRYLKRLSTGCTGKQPNCAEWRPAPMSAGCMCLRTDTAES